MLKWLKRAINQNYKDLQGANKGLRRLSRKLVFMQLDLDDMERQRDFWKERFAETRRCDKEKGQVAPNMPPQGNRSYSLNGSGTGVNTEAPSLPVLPGADTLESAINRS